MTASGATRTPQHWLRDLPALFGFMAITAVAAASGAIARPGDWYAGLIKPPGTPPDWIFPVAWTLLYVAMATAAWLVWRRAGLRGGLVALVPFVGQLGANGLWSILFFGLQRPGLALADLILLWGLILVTIVRFDRFSRPASVLMLPYLAWVSYAGYLNMAIIWLNEL